jgi:hypothetical protein
VNLIQVLNASDSGFDVNVLLGLDIDDSGDHHISECALDQQSIFRLTLLARSKTLSKNAGKKR